MSLAPAASPMDHQDEEALRVLRLILDEPTIQALLGHEAHSQEKLVILARHVHLLYRQQNSYGQIIEWLRHNRKPIADALPKDLDRLLVELSVDRGPGARLAS